jgi:carbonic anhydrase
MSDIKKLLEGYNVFRKKYYEISDTLYKELQYKQTPKTMVISCCDSRVDPAILMNATPGDMFVVRNVANLVPPYEPFWDSKHGTSAAIEFAVRVLEVDNIVILGHSNCGGINAMLHSNEDKFTDLKFLTQWIKIVEQVKFNIPNNTKAEDVNSFCEQESIKFSIRNLLTFPFVKERVEAKTLSLYGWYFNIDDGALYTLDDDYQLFKKQDIN